MNQDKYLKIGEAAKLANVSNVQYLHKLVRKGELPAYYEQRGQMKYWFVDIESQRFKKLLSRHNKDIEKVIIQPHNSIDWIEWEAMARRGEEIVRKPCSDKTIKNYKDYILRFFQTHPTLTRDTLRAALKVYEAKETNKRDFYWGKASLFFSVMTVARYYVYKGYETTEFLKSLEHLRPIQKVKNRNVRWYETEVIQETAEKIHTVKTRMNAPAYTEYNATLNTALLHFALYTAARASEIAEVRLSDIDWKSESIQIYGKGGKWRPIGMSKTLKKSIKAYLVMRSRKAKTDHLFVDDRFKRPLKAAYILRRVKRAGKWMNIVLAPHDIRRSALTWFLTEKKLDLATVRDIAGHTDFKVTNRYTKPSSKHVIEAMKGL